MLYRNGLHEALKGQQAVVSSWNTRNSTQTSEENSFTLIVVKYCNTLPRDVMELPSLEIFKTLSTCCSWLCFEQGFGLQSLQRPLLTSASCDSLRSCESQIAATLNASITDQSSENSETFKNESTWRLFSLLLWPTWIFFCCILIIFVPTWWFF